jgi:hypothetical protein
MAHAFLNVVVEIFPYCKTMTMLGNVKTLWFCHIKVWEPTWSWYPFLPKVRSISVLSICYLVVPILFIEKFVPVLLPWSVTFILNGHHVRWSASRFCSLSYLFLIFVLLYHTVWLFTFDSVLTLCSSRSPCFFLVFSFPSTFRIG